MIGLLQRVSHAEVRIDGQLMGRIDRGLLVLVAVHRDDAQRDVSRLAERILSYRVFPDTEGRMNRSLQDEAGRTVAGASVHAGRGHEEGDPGQLYEGSVTRKRRALF